MIEHLAGTNDLTSVSVVVPVYNSERTIGKTIQSLFALRYPRDRRELIFVDNGSTDGTAAILASYGDRVRTLYEPRRGRSIARNCGIRAARNSVVALTDADCLVDPEWLSRLVMPLKDPGVGISGGVIRALRPCSPIQKFGEGIHDHERAIKVHMPPSAFTVNWASSRNVLLEVGGFDEGLRRGEDVDLAYRIVQAGYRIAYQGEAIVFHHNRSDLKGLFEEGFLHGFYSVPVLKKHSAFVRQYGYRSLYFRSYGAIAANLIRLLRRRSSPDTLFDTTFNSGKRLGKILGSLRFRHFAL